MAASTRGRNPVGSTGPSHTGQNASVITASETNQLKTSGGFLGRVVVWGVGTTWTIDVYDDASANNNRVWGWVSANGVGAFDLRIPMQAGIRVVTGGTAGAATVVWS